MSNTMNLNTQYSWKPFARPKLVKRTFDVSDPDVDVVLDLLFTLEKCFKLCVDSSVEHGWGNKDGTDGGSCIAIWTRR